MRIVGEIECIIIYLCYQVLITKQYNIQKFKLIHCNNFYILLKITLTEEMFSRYITSFHFTTGYNTYDI